MVRLFNSGMASSGNKVASSGGQGESRAHTESEGETEYSFDQITSETVIILKTSHEST